MFGKAPVQICRHVFTCPNKNNFRFSFNPTPRVTPQTHEKNVAGGFQSSSFNDRQAGAKETIFKRQGSNCKKGEG